MRVEGSLQEDPLHPFELEVKKKLAAASSPFDDLAEKEAEDLERKKLKSARKRLAQLLKKGALTPKQNLFFDLFYVKKASNREIARLMSVSRVTVRRYRQKIQSALLRIVRHETETDRIREEMTEAQLTRKQRLILNLRYRDKFDVEEIAKKLGLTKWAVYKLLKRVLKKVSE
jgi:predicted DNA-binding protein YlxM (UPF0122 family)